MRRQPQGRQAKQKAREEAYYKLKEATKPRVKDPKLELNQDKQQRMGGNILKVMSTQLKFAPVKQTHFCLPLPNIIIDERCVTLFWG